MTRKNTSRSPPITDRVADIVRETKISEVDLIGTHTYENVLFTGPESVSVVDVTTGDRPASLNRSLDDALAHAERCTDDVQYVAKRSSTETAIETQSPYSACVFYHFSITGGMEWHSAFSAAVDDPEYTVAHDADYTSGDLTITVTRT